MSSALFIHVLLTLTFLFDAASTSTRPATKLGSFRVVTFGDSTTVGYEIHDGYPRVLAGRLLEQGISATIINSGVSGDTTTGARERFERDVLAHEPHLVIIQFGLNDQTMRLYQKPEEITPYVPLDKFGENLRLFVSTLRERGARTILMTPNPMCWTPTLERYYPKGPFLNPPNGGNALLERYVELIRQIAMNEKVPLVDIFKAYQSYAAAPQQALADLFLPDGVHPNAKGYAMNVDLLLPQLQPLLKPAESASRPGDPGEVAVVRGGEPVCAYIAGLGCSRRNGYFELSRIKHERNPQECISAPLSLGKRDWSVSLEMILVGKIDSNAAILLGENSRITFEADGDGKHFAGPLFVSSAAKKLKSMDALIPPDKSFILGLVHHDQRLILSIDGRDIQQIDVPDLDIGTISVSCGDGTIKLWNFVVHPGRLP